MTAVRDVGDFTTDPGGGGGQEWTTGVRDSLVALWALNGGYVTNVSGTNVVTGTVTVSGGFNAYGDGQIFLIKPVNTNTGAMQVNFNSVGIKPLVGTNGDPLSAGDFVANTLYPVIFLQTDDHFRLITSTGISNVTVQGGIHLHRSVPTRLAAKINNTTSETQVASRSYQAAYSDSRIVVEGSISRLTAAGSNSDAGFSIKLFVDGVAEETITDAEISGAGQTSGFAFEYEPGDTSAHAYSVRCTSTLGAAYYAGATYMVLSEFSPNA